MPRRRRVSVHRRGGVSHSFQPEAPLSILTRRVVLEYLGDQNTLRQVPVSLTLHLDLRAARVQLRGFIADGGAAAAGRD